MSDLSPRDRDVLAAYIGTALNLPGIDEYPAERDALAKAQVAVRAGKTSGVSAAAAKALKGIEVNPGAASVRQSEVRVARTNLAAVLAHFDDSPATADAAEECPFCHKAPHKPGSKIEAEHAAKAADVAAGA